MLDPRSNTPENNESCSETVKGDWSRGDELILRARSADVPGTGNGLAKGAMNEKGSWSGTVADCNQSSSLSI
jgi:hypothetical protein